MAWVHVLSYYPSPMLDRAPNACANISRLVLVRIYKQCPLQKFSREKKQNKFMKVEKGKLIVILLRFDDVTNPLEAIEKYQLNMFVPRVTNAEVS